MENRLYVGNLSYSTTEEDLRELFSNAGTVNSVSIITDRDSGRSKGFGFVEMSSQAEAEKAITDYNGQMMQDRALTVNIARPREERSRSGGSGGYNRGGSSSGGSGGGYNSRGRY